MMDNPTACPKCHNVDSVRYELFIAREEIACLSAEKLKAEAEVIELKKILSCVYLDLDVACDIVEKRPGSEAGQIKRAKKMLDKAINDPAHRTDRASAIALIQVVSGESKEVAS